MVLKSLKKNITLPGKKTMNAKIQQLAEQAYLYQEHDTFLTAALENFAELIVQECARACLAATEPGSSVHLVSVAYADAVKKHFGVE
jgi:hypothetical protein